jgi:toxin secretion/phage lysis holin
MKNDVTAVKAAVTGVFSVLTSVFGILTIPILLMVTCNVIDYITGLFAAKYRNENVNSYKGLRGIAKKVCMWLLVVVGFVIDQLLAYAAEVVGIANPFTYLVACIVALWIICNEIISILENIADIGVEMPGFLMPLVKNIKNQVESAAGEDKLENEEEREEIL